MARSIEYTYVPPAPSEIPKGHNFDIDPPSRIRYFQGAVVAHSNGVPVGALTFKPGYTYPDLDLDAGTMFSSEPTKIGDVSVHPDHQRQGIASDMYKIASQEYGPIEHSSAISPAGLAFAKSVGGHIPESAREGATNEERGENYHKLVMNEATKRKGRKVDAPDLLPAKESTTEAGTQLQFDF